MKLVSTHVSEPSTGVSNFSGGRCGVRANGARADTRLLEDADRLLFSRLELAGGRKPQ
jgi:hypothetical protein